MDHPELIRKINRLQEYIDKLAQYINIPIEQTRESEDKLLAMERSFQLMVDEAIDINAFINFHFYKKVSDSYKSSFYDLAENGLISHDFADKISESAKIRNIVVHEYETIKKVEAIKKIKMFYEIYKEYAKTLGNKFAS